MQMIRVTPARGEGGLEEERREIGGRGKYTEKRHIARLQERGFAELLLFVNALFPYGQFSMGPTYIFQSRHIISRRSYKN